MGTGLRGGETNYSVKLGYHSLNFIEKVASKSREWEGYHPVTITAPKAPVHAKYGLQTLRIQKVPRLQHSTGKPLEPSEVDLFIH
jgi:hypothetical protein